jgi:hydroxymethylbilane synthase
MSDKKIRIGTRGSQLAIIQTQLAIDQLQAFYPDIIFEIVVIKTKGDTITDVPLYECGGKNLFVAQIHEAMQVGEIDIGVHSAKDLDLRVINNITVAAVLKREDPRDVLIARSNHISVVGTCAPRRIALIQETFPDTTIIPLRGNVPTRIKKLLQGQMDAIILAAAGINRLNLWDEIKAHGLTVKILDPEVYVPAAGQGIVALDCLQNRKDIIKLLEPINNIQAMQDFEIETQIVSGISGDCHTAVGVWHKDDYVYGFLKGTKGCYKRKYLLSDNICEDLVAGAGFESTTFRL